MASLILQNGKLLMSDDGDRLLLPPTAGGCCCGGGCCLTCGVADTYFTNGTDEEDQQKNKPHCDTFVPGPELGDKWNCLRRFLGEDGVIRYELPDEPTPSGVHIDWACSTGFSCRLHVMIWEEGLKTQRGILRPDDGNENHPGGPGPWLRGTLRWGKSEVPDDEEDCTECRCFDPNSNWEDYSSVINDPCGAIIPYKCENIFHEGPVVPPDVLIYHPGVSKVLFDIYHCTDD